MMFIDSMMNLNGNALTIRSISNWMFIHDPVWPYAGKIRLMACNHTDAINHKLF